MSGRLDAHDFCSSCGCRQQLPPGSEPSRTQHCLQDTENDTSDGNYREVEWDTVNTYSIYSGSEDRMCSDVNICNG